MHVPRGVWILMTSLLWVASCSPRGDGPGTARFIVVGDAVARDTRTGLEWTRHDDGQGLDWNKAEAYCQALRLDDVGGWRLPDIEELHGLYEDPPRNACGTTTCAIDPVFTLTSQWVWSATSTGGTARTYLDFQSGSQFSPAITPRLLRRVLCVRTAAKDRRA